MSQVSAAITLCASVVMILETVVDSSDGLYRETGSFIVESAYLTTDMIGQVVTRLTGLAKIATKKHTILRDFYTLIIIVQFFATFAASASIEVFVYSLTISLYV